MMNRTKSKIGIDVDWKKRIRLDIGRADDKRRQWYQQIYDKPKTAKFKTAEAINMDKFFGCPRLNKPELYDLPLSTYRNSLSVYPILCSRANFVDELKPVQLSRENIGKLSGISPNTVDHAIELLESIHFEDREQNKISLLERKKVQRGQRRYWEYYPKFIRKDDNADRASSTATIHSWKGRWFPFYTCIIDSGIWARLSTKAKALYLAMRSTSYFDSVLYEEFEGQYIPPIDSDHGPSDTDSYAQRKWEVSELPLKDLFELVCIPYNYTTEIIGELEKVGLVERLHPTKSVFQVQFKPSSLLNK